MNENAFVGQENKDAPVEKPNDDLMTLIVSSQLGRCHVSRNASRQDDEPKLEETETSLENDELDALGLSTFAELPSTTQSGIIGKSKTAVTGLAIMAFDDGEAA